MKNPRSEEEKIIKNVRNVFRLKKKQNDSAIKYTRNTFRLKKEVKGIKDVYLEMSIIFWRGKIIINQKE